MQGGIAGRSTVFRGARKTCLLQRESAPPGELSLIAIRFIDYDSTVVERLRDAGAVLVAITLHGRAGSGGRWFAGMTRNPWQVDEDKIGSSGSSAGPASGNCCGARGVSQSVPKHLARSFHPHRVVVSLGYGRPTDASVAMAQWV
jgi:hypothetical protein